jgi:hypothetical protein
MHQLTQEEAENYYVLHVSVCPVPCRLDVDDLVRREWCVYSLRGKVDVMQWWKIVAAAKSQQRGKLAISVFSNQFMAERVWKVLCLL